MTKLTRADWEGLHNYERTRLKTAGIEVERTIVVEDDHVRPHRLIDARNARVRKILASVDSDRCIPRADQRRVMGEVKKLGDAAVFRHGRLDYAMKQAGKIRALRLKNERDD